MRIIASVQSKRGSSRGLVHYIAHSKIDTEREPPNGRELFNAFADEISVRSANNSLKVDIGRSRPSNEELHHLVLSFRPADHRALGKTERQKRTALKVTTRAAIESLEKAVGAERISWAAAIHLNTANPHVHIAMQKEFLTRDLETRYLAKIPREALPRSEAREGEKVLQPGVLIEAATEKMEELIARERERIPPRGNAPIRNDSGPLSRHGNQRESENPAVRKLTAERDILRRAILAEYQLRGIDSRIELLIEHGDRMRFRVTNPVAGRKTRLSLHDLEARRPRPESEPAPSPEKQIKVILLKMLAKEEAAKELIQERAAETIREASRIKRLYRTQGWKLPVPSLTRDELDELQDLCLQNSALRSFSYLETVRAELENRQEVPARNNEDLGRIAARKTLAEMREQLHQRGRANLSDRRFYSVVDLDVGRVSLVQLDREEHVPTNVLTGLTERLKNAASRLTGKARVSRGAAGYQSLRTEIIRGLDGQLAEMKKEQATQSKMAAVLGAILARGGAEENPIEPVYSTEQLAEVDALSLRLKLKDEHERNWDRQRALIETAASDSPAARRLIKANPNANFTEHKIGIVAGRALARELVCKVELDKAREELKLFTESKRFHKFPVQDRRTGSIAFLSQHDVDLPRQSSVLDRAVAELFEGREHRSLRRTVMSMANGREQRLKNEVDAARLLEQSAARYALEFKQSPRFGLQGEPTHRPLFTSSELAFIETRIAGTRNSNEAATLQKILSSADDNKVRSLAELLRDFEDPKTRPAKGGEITIGTERDSNGRPRTEAPGCEMGERGEPSGRRAPDPTRGGLAR